MIPFFIISGLAFLLFFKVFLHTFGYCRAHLRYHEKFQKQILRHSKHEKKICMLYYFLNEA